MGQLATLAATDMAKISIRHTHSLHIDSCINCTADVPLPKLFTDKKS